MKYILEYNEFNDLTTEEQEIKDKALTDGTFMKAPNGKKTKLNEKQWLQVRTQKFINWFGDWINDPKNSSKILDKNKEPMIVYHGSAKIHDFNIFKPNKGVIYVASDKYESTRYISIKDGSEQEKMKYVKSFYANIKNLVDLSLMVNYPDILEFINNNSEELLKQANEKFMLEKELDFDDLDYILDYKFEDPIKEWQKKSATDKIVCLFIKKTTSDWMLFETDIFINFIKGSNYDGYVTHEYEENYAVFTPNQIKSATNNNGDFNPKDENINK